MRVMRASDYKRMPWKNGGGVTTEIAASPDGTTLDAFDWRVSMATVATAGAFSMFADVDRTLVVLDGDGLHLTLTGRPAVILSPDSPPFAFAADTPTSATLINGPVTDFNVMVRRGRFDLCVDRLESGTHPLATDDGAWRLVFCARGTVTIEDQSTCMLNRYDAYLAHGTGCTAVAHPGTTAYLVTLTRRAGAKKDSAQAL